MDASYFLDTGYSNSNINLSCVGVIKMKSKKLIGRLSEIEPSPFPEDETYEQRIVTQNACRDRQISNGFVCIADYGVEMFCNYKCSRCNYGVRI